MATRKPTKTSMDKYSDVKKTYERVCRRGTRKSRFNGIRISYRMLNKLGMGLCFITLLVVLILNLLK